MKGFNTEDYFFAANKREKKRKAKQKQKKLALLLREDSMGKVANLECVTDDIYHNLLYSFFV